MPESHVVKRARGVGADRGIGATDGPPVPAVHLVIPARGGHGKTRLIAPGNVRHAGLARALAQDTIQAALDCDAVASVVVVTSDRRLAAWARSWCRVLADPGTGLSGAIATGLAALAAADVAGVLLADLPALSPTDLATALRAASQRPAFVPDAAGTGTVLLTGRAAELRPAFGPGSAAAHARHAVRLELDLPRLRRDVDDAADLAAALTLGVGRHTAAALLAPHPRS